MSTRFGDKKQRKKEPTFTNLTRLIIILSDLIAYLLLTKTLLMRLFEETTFSKRRMSQQFYLFMIW